MLLRSHAPLWARLALAAALVPALAACDSEPPTGPVEPQPDRVVGGVNVTRLFAAPTAAEIAQVRAELAERERTRAGRYTYTLEATLADESGAEVRVLAGRDAAGAVLHYGLVRLPLRAAGDATLRPLLLVLPEDGPVAVPAALGATGLAPAQRESFAYAVLAYRGRPLTVGGRTFTSPADAAAAYDLDADDALAFFDAARALPATRVDPSRAGVTGYGRGGAVALLAASRPAAASRFRIAVDLAGPTDFFLADVQTRSEGYLTGRSFGAFPAFADVAAAVLAPLRAGTLSTAEARLALLRRSPSYLLGAAPFVAAAYGEGDLAVVPAHGGRLTQALLEHDQDGVFLPPQEADHTTLPTANEVVSTLSQLIPRYVSGS